MSDLYRTLEADPATLALLASTPGDTLAHHAARQIVKSREVEEERRRRRDREAEMWRRHEEERYLRAIAPPPPPLPDDVLRLSDVPGLAKATSKLIQEKIGRVQVDLDRVESQMDGYRALISDCAAEMTERLAEVEKQAMKYEGAWDCAKVYHPHTVITYGGNLWHCEQMHSNARPGTSDSWTLMQKTKGRQ